LARNQDNVQSGVTCLHMDWCFSELPLKMQLKSQCVGLVQSLAELEFDLKKFEFQLW